MNRRTGLWLLCLTCTMLGCDNRPPAPPPKAISPATVPEKPRPTTQELLSGEYKVMPLPNMPLAIKVPQSWAIDVSNKSPATFLTGPTPTDKATIQLSQQAFRGGNPDILFASAKKEQQQRPASMLRAEMRTLGKLQILERISISRAINSPKLDEKGDGILDAQGNLVMTTSTPVHWTLSVFQPEGKEFTRYELNFIDLNQDQFNVDRDFLQKIIDTLSYTGPAEPASMPGF